MPGEIRATQKIIPELLGVFGDYRANRSDDFASQFNLRRARLLFLGHLLSPDFKYFLQIGFETAENAQTPGSANLLDYYVLSTHLPALKCATGPVQDLLQPLTDQQHRLHAIRRTGAGHGCVHGQRHESAGYRSDDHER